MNNKYSISKNTTTKRELFISQTENSIIPIDSSDEVNEYYIVPPTTNSTFNTSIVVKEDEDNIKLSPFDMFKEDDSLSIFDIIKSDVELKKGDKLGVNYKYEFEGNDKKALDTLISKSSIYTPDDFLGILVDILEEYSTIPYYDKNEDKYKDKDFQESDLLELILQLSSAFKVDTILFGLKNELSSEEFYQLILATSEDEKTAIFKKVLAFDNDVEEEF